MLLTSSPSDKTEFLPGLPTTDAGSRSDVPSTGLEYPLLAQAVAACGLGSIFIECFLPDAEECVKMAIASLSCCAFLCIGCVLFGKLFSTHPLSAEVDSQPQNV